MPFDWLIDELARREAAGLLRRPRVLRSLPDGWIEVDGRRLRNLAGNDYLNLAGDPRVVAAARQAISEQGFGARASALVSGRSPWHAILEARLAEFEGEQAALLFPTGYAANLGVLSALAGPEDVLCFDRLNHASLIDGCRLSGARLRVIPHNDPDAMARELTKAQGARRRFIVVDSIFSMDGDTAPLPEWLALAEQHDALLILDEAHATGVLGAHGRGLAEHHGLESSRLVRIGTLSKALGALGGFVAGPQPLIDFLFNAARTQMFSTALPAAACAAALAAIEIVEQAPQLRARLHTHTVRLRERLLELGVTTPATAIPTPIVPVIVDSPERVLTAARRLEVAGYLTGAIRPPTVPEGTCRLRISLHAGLGDDEISEIAAAVQAAVTAAAGS